MSSTPQGRRGRGTVQYYFPRPRQCHCLSTRRLDTETPSQYKGDSDMGDVLCLTCSHEEGMVRCGCSPSTWKTRQEDCHEFQARLGYIERPLPQKRGWGKTQCWPRRLKIVIPATGAEIG